MSDNCLNDINNIVTGIVRAGQNQGPSGVKSCALNEKSIDKKGIAFTSIITFFRYFVAFSIEKQTCCPGGQTPDW